MATGTLRTDGAGEKSDYGGRTMDEGGQSGHAQRSSFVASRWYASHTVLTGVGRPLTRNQWTRRSSSIESLAVLVVQSAIQRVALQFFVRFGGSRACARCGRVV